MDYIDLTFLKKYDAKCNAAADILRADNDAAHRRRLDLLQSDMEQLMLVDMEAVIERVVNARNTVIARQYGSEP